MLEILPAFGRSGGSGPTTSFFDRRFLDVVELWKFLREVGISAGSQLRLLRSLAAGRAFAVAAIELVDNVHARRDLAERRKSHLVVPRVVDKAHEELCGP